MSDEPVKLFEKETREIKKLLAESGFSRSKVTSGSSSGGPFVSCDFGNGNIEIGLIVRGGSRLGCPNYTAGKGYAGHEGLMSVLGCGEESSLIPGEWPDYVARDEGSSFDALFNDLSSLILPQFRKSKQEFENAINKAYRDRWK